MRFSVPLLLKPLLLDRNSLSRKNGWFDEEGYIYIYFSREEMAKLMGISVNSVTKLFAELKEAELVEEVRQGSNKPNIIYVGEFIDATYVTQESQPKSQILENRTPKKLDSGVTSFGSPESQVLGVSYTEKNFTENSDNELVSLSQSAKSANLNLSSNKINQDELTDELTNIFNQSQIELFEENNLKQTLQEIIKEIYIEEQNIIKKLEISDIDTAIAKFRTYQNEKEIKNPKLYFKKCLLSAIKEKGLIKLKNDVIEQDLKKFYECFKS